MNREKDEALYLVDGSYYFHLRETEQGFAYRVYDTDTKAELGSGTISREDMASCPIRKPIACARKLAFDEYGAEGLTVQSVALKTLEQIPPARRAYRKEHNRLVHDHSIRFIDSSYNEQFRIPDGGTIQALYPDGVFIQKCAYVDDYHTKIGNNLYHICQFAEILERNGGTVRPEPEILSACAAWEIGHHSYLTLQECDGGWDYTLYDKSFRAVEGGQLDAPELSMIEAREYILDALKLSSRVRTPADFEQITQRAEQEAARSVLTELKAKQAETGLPSPRCSRKGAER